MVFQKCPKQIWRYISTLKYDLRKKRVYVFSMSSVKRNVSVYSVYCCSHGITTYAILNKLTFLQAFKTVVPLLICNNISPEGIISSDISSFVRQFIKWKYFQLYSLDKKRAIFVGNFEIIFSDFLWKETQWPLYWMAIIT